LVQAPPDQGSRSRPTMSTTSQAPCTPFNNKYHLITHSVCLSISVIFYLCHPDRTHLVCALLPLFNPYQKKDVHFRGAVASLPRRKGPSKSPTEATLSTSTRPADIKRHIRSVGRFIHCNYLTVCPRLHRIEGWVVPDRPRFHRELNYWRVL